MRTVTIKAPFCCVCVSVSLTFLCSCWLDEEGQSLHRSSELLFESQQILRLLSTCQGEGLLLHHLNTHEDDSY